MIAWPGTVICWNDHTTSLVGRDTGCKGREADYKGLAICWDVYDTGSEGHELSLVGPETSWDDPKPG